MVKLGYRKIFDGAASVTHLSSAGGWQEVDRIRFADFGTAGDDRYAFIVWGRAGAIQTTGSMSNAQIRVGVGIPNKVDPRNTHVCTLSDVSLSLLAGNKSLPFFFIVMIDGTARDFGNPAISNWTANDPFAVFARTELGPGDTGTCTFQVGDLSYLVLNLDKMDTATPGYAYSDTYAGGVVNNALSSESKLILDQQTLFSIVGGVEWLLFAQVVFAPRNTQLSTSPWFEFGTTTDGTLGTFMPILGRHRFGVPAMKGISSLGFPTQSFGGFAPVVPANNVNVKAAAVSRDQHAVGAQRTWIFATKMLAVEIDKFAYFRKKTYVSYPENPIASGVTAPFGTLNFFQPFEIQVPRGSDYTTLHYAAVKHEGPSGAQRSFTPLVRTDTSGRLLRSALLYPVVRHPNDGVPLLTMVPELIAGPPGQQAESRYQFHHWERPGGPGTEAWDTGDVVNVGFYLDDDPQNAVDPPPTPLPPVIIAPGKEALDLGSLNELPIPPDFDEGLVTEALIESLITDTGYERTWPVQIGVRNQQRWTWTGLSVSDRDALVAFFRANATFKWTRPGEATATPYAVMGLLDWTDVGILHSGSLNVAELVRIGS